MVFYIKNLASSSKENLVIMSDFVYYFVYFCVN